MTQILHLIGMSRACFNQFLSPPEIPFFVPSISHILKFTSCISVVTFNMFLVFPID